MTSTRLASLAFLPLALLALLASPAPADACDCDYPRPFELEQALHPIHVHVRVHTTPAPSPNRLLPRHDVTLEVLRVLQGQVYISAIPLRRGNDCDTSPEELRDGEELIVLLDRADDPNGVVIDGCTALIKHLTPRPE